MSIKPINKNIIFVFKDKVNTRGEFTRAPTASGIELVGGYDDSAKQSRWAVVIAAGSMCEAVTPGQEILIPALRWTNSIKVGGQTFWKTDETQVVACRKNSTSPIVPLSEYVLFSPLPRKAIKSQFLIVPTVDAEALAEGTVVAIGGKASPELQRDVTLYYSDINFDEFLEHNGQRLGFIKDADVIAYSNQD